MKLKTQFTLALQQEGIYLLIAVIILALLHVLEWAAGIDEPTVTAQMNRKPPVVARRPVPVMARC